jgi:aspartyl-tRNA(Asn)/glutamyl-tRNA(Gln) amidotransferase subunit A
VSRYGLIAFASSLDQAGPLTRSVADAGVVLSAIAGLDPLDSTTLDTPVPDWPVGAPGDLTGLRVGVPEEHFAAGLDDGVRDAVEAAVSALEALGAQRVAVGLPNARYAVAVYYLVANAEASANLARYDGVRYGHAVAGHDIWERIRRSRGEGFGAEVKRRIMLGTFALSSGYHDAYYLRATEARARIRADLDAALERCDLLVGPTTPTPAFRLGEKVDDPLAMYLNDIFTIPANLAGYPALSMPCGLSQGLPVGLQLTGRPLDEATLLRVAAAYEAAAGPALTPPAVSESVERSGAPS